MKTSLTFLAVVAVIALLMMSTPGQVLSFVGACALLGGAVMHRKRQSHLD